MTKVTRALLFAFVFTVPWDNFALPVLGSVSRAFGLAVVAAAVATTALRGRIRKPDAVLCFALAFGGWTALSLLWTMTYATTVVRAITFVQLAASVWVIREFVRTREEVETLVIALCFGLFVPLVDLLNNFRTGRTISVWQSRYTAVGINADGIGLLMVLGFPIAWHLLMRRRGLVRVVALIYVAAAPIGLMLTATRGAFVAGMAALLIVPLSLARQSLRSYALTGGLLLVAALAAAVIVPQSNWNRLMSTSTELADGGSLTGRTVIWQAGLRVLPERPLLGAGAGAYGAAVAPYLPNTKGVSAHNVAIGLLVEEGLIGFGLFLGVIGACVGTIARLPPGDRALWGVLILTWIVGSMSGSSEAMKFTWVIFGLVSAQSGLTKTVRDVPTTDDPVGASASIVERRYRLSYR